MVAGAASFLFSCIMYTSQFLLSLPLNSACGMPAMQAEFDVQNLKGLCNQEGFPQDRVVGLVPKPQPARWGGVICQPTPPRPIWHGWTFQRPHVLAEKTHMLSLKPFLHSKVFIRTSFLSVSGSDKPGVVTVQLETNDGRVLGSTKFVYKEEICTGFKKIVSSTNYRGKLLQAFCNKETKKTLVTNSQTETHPGKDLCLQWFLCYRL